MKYLFICWAWFFFLLDWLPTKAVAQDRVLTGQVLGSDSRQGLPGVTVLAVGTAIGTATNADGTFTLSGVPATVTRLRFSTVGYTTVEKEITTTPLSVTLVVKHYVTEEVVVTGLATSIQRSNLANNVATISGRQLVGHRSWAGSPTPIDDASDQPGSCRLATAPPWRPAKGPAASAEGCQ